MTEADENNNDDLDPAATWQDNFYGSSVDTAKWRVDVSQGGGFGNSEPQIYRTKNVYLANGKLVIKLEKSGSYYYSGRVCTLGKRTFTNGTLQARIKVPSGNALWPAFWMVGAYSNADTSVPTTINTSTGSFTGWPYCGEIDIMEFRGDIPTKVMGTLHWNAPDDGSSHGSYGTSKTSADFSQDYHVYSMTKTSSQITIAVDGVTYFTMGTTASDATEFQQGFIAILNLAMGGSSTAFTGYKTIDSSTLPKYMYVDWVRFYAQ